MTVSRSYKAQLYGIVASLKRVCAGGIITLQPYMHGNRCVCFLLYKKYTVCFAVVIAFAEGRENVPLRPLLGQ